MPEDADGAEGAATPLTDRVAQNPERLAKFEAMTVVEKALFLRDFVQTAAPENLASEIDEFLRFVSDNYRSLGARDRDLYGAFAPLREMNGAQRSAVADQIQQSLDRLIETNRRSGSRIAEIVLIRLKAAREITEEPIFANRAAHRRASELEMLDHWSVKGLADSIGISMRDLSEKNDPELALRAGFDTLTELDLAGVEPRWPLLVAYGEALALAGREDQVDGPFRRAYESLENLENTVDTTTFEGRFALIERPKYMQFVANQWAFYLNIVGKFAEAEEPGLYAANAAEKLEGRESISTQKSRYNYAVALLGQGKAAQALPYFEEALPLQRAEEKASETRNSEIGRKKDTVLLLTTLARSRIQVPGREDDALLAALEAAEAVRTLRDQRLNGGAAGDSADPSAAALAKAIARGNRRDPLSPAFDMVMLTGWLNGSGTKEHMDVAFRAAQDLTLNEAGSAISQAAARELAGEGELGELVRERQDTAAQIVSINDEYRQALTGTDADRVASLNDQLGRLGKKLATLDARLEAEFPEYGDLVAPRSVAVDAVRRALSGDEALLMLLPSEGHHYVFAITQEQAVWHRAENGASEAELLIERLRCRMDEATCSADEYDRALDAEEQSGPEPIDANYPRYDQAAAHRLYNLLVAPVADAIGEKEIVYTVAAGPVASLPLAALITEKPAVGGSESGDPDVLRNAPWLGERHAFVTLPSVSAITLPRPDQKRATSGLVGYGAPVLLGQDGAGSRGAVERRRRGGTATMRAASFFRGGGDELKVDPEKLRRLDPLPGTERELAMLALSLERGKAELRLGEEATETSVKNDSALASAAVVVFATHGLLPGEMGQAADPGLVLTPPLAANSLDDGLLTASEAAELSLAAQWLILSACNTASPEGEQGAEALSGLARAFLYAGAESLLASHWRVSDDASAELTVQTIRAGQVGLSQAEALQAGQSAVRNGIGIDDAPITDWKPHWAHPAAWAPFTLISDHNRQSVQ